MSAAVKRVMAGITLASVCSGGSTVGCQLKPSVDHQTRCAISTPIARCGRRINFALVALQGDGTVTEYPRYKLVQDHLGFKVTAPKDVMAHAGACPSASKHNGQIDFQRWHTPVRHASLGST
jgi:hypothetical protein